MPIVVILMVLLLAGCMQQRVLIGEVQCTDSPELVIGKVGLCNE